MGDILDTIVLTIINALKHEEEDLIEGGERNDLDGHNEVNPPYVEKVTETVLK